MDRKENLERSNVSSIIRYYILLSLSLTIWLSLWFALIFLHCSTPTFRSSLLCGLESLTDVKAGKNSRTEQSPTPTGKEIRNREPLSGPHFVGVLLWDAWDAWPLSSSPWDSPAYFCRDCVAWPAPPGTPTSDRSWSSALVCTDVVFSCYVIKHTGESQNHFPGFWWLSQALT